MLTYTEAENCWQILHREDGSQRTSGCRLWLEWRVADTSPTLGWSPEDVDALELFRRWARAADSEIKLHWTVASNVAVVESAPFIQDTSDDFLSFYRWPTQCRTGEPLNWLRLPVADLMWDDTHSEEWGIIQSAIGWKPSPLQRSVPLNLLLEASGHSQSRR